MFINREISSTLRWYWLGACAMLAASTVKRVRISLFSRLSSSRMSGESARGERVSETRRGWSGWFWILGALGSLAHLRQSCTASYCAAHPPPSRSVHYRGANVMGRVGVDREEEGTENGLGADGRKTGAPGLSPCASPRRRCTARRQAGEDRGAAPPWRDRITCRSWEAEGTA